MAVGRLTRAERAAILCAAEALKEAGVSAVGLLDSAAARRRRGQPRLPADEARQAGLDLLTLHELTRVLKDLDGRIPAARKDREAIGRDVEELQRNGHGPAFHSGVLADLLAAHRTRKPGDPSLRERAAMWLAGVSTADQGLAAIDRWKKRDRARGK